MTRPRVYAYHFEREDTCEVLSVGTAPTRAVIMAAAQRKADDLGVSLFAWITSPEGAEHIYYMEPS